MATPLINSHITTKMSQYICLIDRCHIKLHRGHVVLQPHLLQQIC